MSCDRCFDVETGGHPHDYGYSLPDTRDRFRVLERCSCWVDETADCGECHGERWVPTGGEITITIRREYGECDCGSGEAVLTKVYYRIKGPGCTVDVPRTANPSAVVKAIWPRSVSTGRAIGGAPWSAANY